MADQEQHSKIENRASQIKKEADQLAVKGLTLEIVARSVPVFDSTNGTVVSSLMLAGKFEEAKGDYLKLQSLNLRACPETIEAAKADLKLKPYPKRSGEVLFHGGGKGFVGFEEKNQRECTYDGAGSLQLGAFEGSLNQWDSAKHPVAHTFNDFGGIFSAYGWGGFYNGILKPGITSVRGLAPFY